MLETPPPPIAPLLIDARAAGRLCGIGRTAWYALVSSGRAPAAIRLGGRVLWHRDTLAAWCAAGCPSRDIWEVRKGRRP
jgi:predicted DNA-binding transcriptional regulator AlpA